MALTDDPLDALVNMPGYAGDVARERLENPPLLGEMPDDTLKRQTTQQVAQQRSIASANRIKAADLGRRRIPTFTDETGQVQPVTDPSGAPIQHYDRRANVGFDSAGKPVQLAYGLAGAPEIEDAFAGIPVTTDPKTGHQYKIRRGLPHQWVGRDEDIAKREAQKEREKTVRDAAAALGQKLTIDQRDFVLQEKEQKKRTEALMTRVPDLFGRDAATLDEKRAVIDEFYNRQYAAPDANTGTPESLALRKQIDSEKAAAYADLDATDALTTEIGARREKMTTEKQIRDALQRERAGMALGRAGIDLGAAPEKPLYQEVEKDGKKQIEIDQDRPLDALVEAVRANVIEMPDQKTLEQAAKQQSARAESVATAAAAGTAADPTADQPGIGDDIRNVGRALVRGYQGLKQSFFGSGVGGAFTAESDSQRAQQELAEFDALLATPDMQARMQADPMAALSFQQQRLQLQSRVAALAQEATTRSETVPGSLAQIQAAEKIKRANPASGGLKEFHEGDWVKALATNPVEVVAGLVAESLPQMAPGMLATAATGPAGGVLVTGASSFSVEYANGILESLQEQGADLSKPETVQAVFSDPDKLRKAKMHAMARGVPVSAFDAASAGLAGKILKQALGKGAKKVIAASGGELALQAGLGASGEAGAQLVSKGKIDDVRSIAAEAIAELGSAPAEVAGNILADRRKQAAATSGVQPPTASGTKQTPPTQPSPTTPPSGGTPTPSTPAKAPAATGGKKGVAATPTATPDPKTVAAPSSGAAATGTDATGTPDVKGTKTVQWTAKAGGKGAKFTGTLVSENPSHVRVRTKDGAEFDVDRERVTGIAWSTDSSKVSIDSSKGGAAPAPALSDYPAWIKANRAEQQTKAEEEARNGNATASESVWSDIRKDYAREQIQKGATPDAIAAAVFPTVDEASGKNVRKLKDAYLEWVKSEAAKPATPATGAAAPTAATTSAPTEAPATPAAGGAGAAGTASGIDTAAHGAASSPENNLPEPTDAQKKAGNYQKGHIRLAGMDVSIENPAGSTRSGTDATGKPWRVTMQDHYGYIRGSKGKDGDHIDLFVKPGTPEDYSGPVFVVNQMNASGEFDEHKAVFGASDVTEAKSLYKRNYNAGQSREGSIAQFSSAEAFRQWATGAIRRTAPAKGDVTSDSETKTPTNEVKPASSEAPAAPEPSDSPAPKTDASANEGAGGSTAEDQTDTGGVGVRPTGSAGAAESVAESVRLGVESVRQHLKDAGFPESKFKLWADVWPGQPPRGAGIGLNMVTGDFVMHPERFQQSAATVAKNGLDVEKWVALSVDEELAHRRDWLVSGNDYQSKHSLFFAQVPQPIRDQMRQVYPHLTSAWQASGELLRMLDQVARLGEFSEMHHSGKAKAESLKLLGMLEGWTPPKPILDHLTLMRNADHAAESHPQPDPKPQPQGGALSPDKWTEAHQKEYRRRKTALAKAIKAQEWQRVIDHVDDDLAHFEKTGYPDDWSNWERAKEDAQQRLKREDSFLKPPAPKPEQQPPAPQQPPKSKASADSKAKLKDAAQGLFASQPERQNPLYRALAQQARRGSSPTQPRPVSPSDRKRIQDAYRAVTRETFFPVVRIADVLERAGYTPQQADMAKGILAQMARDGDVILSGTSLEQVGDRVRAWSVRTIAGPFVSMRMKPQMLEASRPTVEQRGIPKEKRAAFMAVAQQLADEDVSTPQEFVAVINDTFGDDAPKMMPYSDSIWQLVAAFIDPRPQTSGIDWPALFQGQAPAADTAPATGIGIAQQVARALATGSLDRRGLAEMAKGSTLSAKEIDEAAEFGIVLRAREIVAEGRGPQETFNALVELYSRQPNLTSKTSTSKVNQAYSTPSPLAYALGKRIRLEESKNAAERTAGNGLLTIAGNPEHITVNEIDPVRAANLREQGFRAVTMEDAVTHRIPGTDREIMNPPFGTVLEDGEKKSFPLYVAESGILIETPNIDMAIVMRALQDMGPDAKAGIIIGGKKGTHEERTKSYGVFKTQLPFFKELYDKYNVVDHFTVAGDLYEKQGAGWPVDVIVVEGKGKSALPYPFADAPPVLDSWQQVGDRLLSNESVATNRPPAVNPADSESGSTAPVPAGSGGATGNGSLTPGGRRPQSSGGNKPAANGDTAGGVDGQPGNSGAVTGSGSGSATVTSGGSRGGGVRPDTAPDGDARPVAAGPQDPENSLQSGYAPRSSSPSLAPALTPVNLLDPQREALDALEQRRGKIDDFVLKSLDWLPDMKTLHSVLDGGQVDAVALAIDNIMRGGALITGDQTGMGKGRVAAAVLAWSQRQGHIPVFMTKNDTLYKAMAEDFADIKAEFMVPFFTNVGFAIKNEAGETLFRSAAGDRQKKLIQGIIDTGKLPGNSTVIFTTYDQIKGDEPSGFREEKKIRAARKKNRIPRADGMRMAMFRKLANRMVFVLDESHMAAGDSDTGYRMMQLLMGWDIQNAPLSGDNVRPVGVYYSSATFAKRADNMPIYAMTDLGKAVQDPKSLPEIFAKGGVAMQQVVSAMLARAGQYIRREMDFSGINFNDKVVGTREEQWRQADQFTTPLRDIVDFSSHVQTIIGEINAVLQADGVKIDGVDVAEQLSGTEFADQLHNMVNQYLLAVKAKAVAEDAVAMLAKGIKPVITVENTMEGPYKDTIAQGFEPNFRGLLDRYLANSLDVTRTKIDGTRVKERLNLEALMQHESKDVRRLAERLQDEFDTIQDAIRATDLGDLHISPIDTMREVIEAGGYKAGEITGRKLGVRRDGKTYDRPAVDTKATGKNRILSEFNNGGIDALILNRSGSTGISAHNAPKFKDQRPRKMLIAQPNADISEMMQMYGRINRKGQITLPEYFHMASQIAAELRVLANLKRKLRGLKANTTSNTEGAEKTEVPELFNNYGDISTYVTLERHPEIVELLRNTFPGGVLPPRYTDDGKDDMRKNGDFFKRVSGEINVLPAEWQQRFYDEVDDEFRTLVEYQTSIGENELIVENHDYKATVLKSEELAAASGSTEFEAAAVIETLQTKAGRMPVPIEEVKQIARDGAEDVRKQVADWDASVQPFREKRIAEMEAKNGGKEYWPAQRQQMLDRMDRDEATIRNAMNLFGRGVVVDIDGGTARGIVTGVKIDPSATLTPSKQMVVVHINTSKQKTSFPASMVAQRVSEVPLAQVEARYDESANTQQTRFVATGNLVAAFEALETEQGVSGGKIITFTMEDGTVRQGILLPQTYNPGRAMVPIRDAAHLDETLSKSITVRTPSHLELRNIGRPGEYEVRVPASKQKGGKFWREKRFTDLLVGGNMIGKGSDMVGLIRRDRIGELHAYLAGNGEKLRYSEPPKRDGNRLEASRPQMLEASRPMRAIDRAVTATADFVGAPLREANKIGDAIDRVASDALAAVANKTVGRAQQALASKLAGTDLSDRFTALKDAATRQIVPYGKMPEEAVSLFREQMIQKEYAKLLTRETLRLLSKGDTSQVLGMTVPAADATRDNREKLTLVLEGKAPANILPASLQALAPRIRSMIQEYGLAAVDGGLLKRETYNRNRDTYLPILYKDHELAQRGMKGVGIRFRRLILDRFKPRLSDAWAIKDAVSGKPINHKTGNTKSGPFRFDSAADRDIYYQQFLEQRVVQMLNQDGHTDITPADLPAFSALGHPLHDTVERLKANVAKRYVKVDPLTEAEYDALGRIRDAAYPVSKALLQMGHDASIAKLLKDLKANPEWVRRTEEEGFTRIPYNPRYGVLAGRWVQDDIALALQEVMDAPHWAAEIYDNVLRRWKKWKTVYNPATHGRNIIGNFGFATLAGNNPLNPANYRYYREMVDTLRGKNPRTPLEELYRMGVLGGDITTNELNTAMRDVVLPPLPGDSRWITDLLTLRAVRDLAQKAYRVEDDMFKVAAYLRNKDLGMSPKEAAAEVRQWFPYYDQLPTSLGMKIARRTSFPFASFFYESVRIGKQGLQKKPMTMMALLALPTLITTYSLLKLGLTDKDIEAVTSNMRGKMGNWPVFSALLPDLYDEGRPMQWDLTNTIPYADLLGKRMDMGDKDPRWWESIFKRVMTGNPFGNIFAGLAFNEDPFTSRPLMPTGSTTGETAANLGTFVGKTMLPPLTPGVGTTWGTITAPDRFRGSLEKRSQTQATVRALAGVDVRNAAPSIGRMIAQFKKRNGLPDAPTMDDSTPRSRSRDRLYTALINDDEDGIATEMRTLAELGAPLLDAKDVREFVQYRHPLRAIRKTDRPRFMAQLAPVERRTVNQNLTEYSRIMAQAPSKLLRHQAAPKFNPALRFNGFAAPRD